MAARKSYNFICKGCGFRFSKSLTRERAREMLAGKMPACKECGTADTERALSRMSSTDRAKLIIEQAKESDIKPGTTWSPSYKHES